MKVKYVIIGACLATLFLNACKKQSIEELPTTMCNIVEPIDTIPQYNHWSDTCPPNVHALACSLEYRIGKWVEVLDSATAVHRSPDTFQFVSSTLYNYIHRDTASAFYKPNRQLQYYFQWSIWHFENFKNLQNSDGSLIWAQTNTYFDKDKEHFYYRTVTNPVRTYRYKKLE